MIERKKSLVPLPSQDLSVVETAPQAGRGSRGGARRDPPPPPRRRVLAYVLVPVLAVLGFGAFMHWRTYAAAATTQRQQADFVPQVRTAEAQRDDKPIELTLPGQTEAFDTANIFPRASGYVAERFIDIGSHVTKGELMLRIEAPDLDQQLAQAQAQIGQNQAGIVQAQAQLRTAQANTKLAGVTKFRTTTLASEGWETRQNADNATANNDVQVASVANAQAGIDVAQANLKAQQATVDRLTALTAFEQVRAPFTGVVTARNVDTGDLLTQDSTGGTPILSVARDDVLRIAVYVPQSSAIGIRDGLEAKVTVPEIPNRVFTGRVARSSVALQSASRSLLVEVDVANPDGALRAGLYVTVGFAIPRQAPGVVVPDEALVFDAQGLQVATLQDDQTVKFRKVSIYRDFGTTAELRDGLQGGETLILSPPTELADGSKVKPVKPQPEKNAQESASR